MATTSWWVVAGLLCATASLASADAGETGSDHGTLLVRTYDRFGLDANSLSVAEATAGLVFQNIGIHVAWTNCGAAALRHPPRLPHHCDEAVTGAEVVLRVVAAGQTEERASMTMGLALVRSDANSPGVLATVFADRVLAVARTAGVDPRPLLGMAIGHELGHLLLSTPTHAALGLMRADWSQAELRRTKPADWRFLDSEAEIIQNAVTRRLTAPSSLP